MNHEDTLQVIRDRGRDMYGEQGHVEIDEIAHVSISERGVVDGGVYVAAWVWVPITKEEADECISML